MSNESHRWSFFRAGGVDQVAIRDGRDLANLKKLDQKLWVALAMPTKGVALDEKTLKLLDQDGDARVRVPDVLGAIEWSGARLESLDLLLKPGDSIPLSAIQKEPLRATARRVLESIAKGEGTGTVPPPPSPPPTEIALKQIVDVLHRYVERPFNGDGVVVEEAAPDDETRAVLKDILATVGGEADRSGKQGMSQAKLEAFFKDAQAHLDWASRSQQSPELLPLGDGTAAAAAAVRGVRDKVDDFFLRCRLAALDERTASGLASAAELNALAGKLLNVGTPELRSLPLARVSPGGSLPLLQGTNPAWSAELSALVEKAVRPALGDQVRDLDEAAWSSLKARLAPFEEWQAVKPTSPVETLGLDRLRAICGGTARETLAKLVKDDLELHTEMDQLGELEKLLLFRRDLATLVQNFVNFSRFYARAPEGAVFQAGTLYIDGRACRLTLEVADTAKHGLLATMSSAYLLYCDCLRKDGQKKTIVAAVTAGDADRLFVGRNGVFYDRQGQDWDATVTKIIAQPISVGEAFWTPYKKLARMIEEQFAKRAAASDAESQAKLSTTAQAVAAADQTKPPAPGAPAAPGAAGAPAKKMDVGTVAAIGVAIGGIGAMVTGILTAFFGLGFWMPIGLLAVLLLISGPSMLLAYLKLRQRNLGPILDANFWAVNGRARINVPFGRALTDQAALPPGSERVLRDPYADKKSHWRLYLFLLVLAALGACWARGYLDSYLPESIQSTRVLGR